MAEHVSDCGSSPPAAVVKKKKTDDAASGQAAAQVVSAAAAALPAGVEEPEAEAAGRCATCKEKLGLLGFACRCGGAFCKLHRFAEKHACVLYFKDADDQKQIAKEQPGRSGAQISG